MPVPYPPNLPTVLASKRVSKGAAFSAANPRQGAPYFERTGTDTPTIFQVEWLLTATQALILRNWVENDLLGGALQFVIPLRTETGLLAITGNFLPGGLLDRSRDGALWRYRANIVSRTGDGPVIVPAPPPPPEVDPFFANVSLLLSGQAFVDSSPRATPVTPFGGAEINESIYRFDGGAIDIPGSGYVSIPDSPLFEWWAADTTIEYWVYPRAYSSLFGKTAPETNSTAWLFGLTPAGLVNLFWWTGFANNIQGTTVLPLNDWSHIAMSVQGSTIRVFARGALEGVGTRTTPVSITQNLIIGRGNGSSGNFLVGAARITSGVARYIDSFTPPSRPFPSVGP